MERIQRAVYGNVMALRGRAFRAIQETREKRNGSSIGRIADGPGRAKLGHSASLARGIVVVEEA